MTNARLHVIAGPMPCAGCRTLVVYARRQEYDWQRPDAKRKGWGAIDVMPDIRDAGTGDLHDCAAPRRGSSAAEQGSYTPTVAGSIPAPGTTYEGERP